MAPYFGLSGRRLHTAIWIQSWVAVSIFGYSSAGAGGVLNLPSFVAQFPSLDVKNAPPSQVHYKSTIQGIEQFYCLPTKWLSLTLSNRDNCSTLHAVWCLRSIGLHFSGRLSGTSKNHLPRRCSQLDRCHPYGQFLLFDPVHLRSYFPRLGDWWNCCNCSSMAV